MTFPEWLKSQPRGAMRRVELVTGCSRNVVSSAAHGRPVSRKIAEKISAATVGAVSPQELVFPPADRQEGSDAR